MVRSNPDRAPCIDRCMRHMPRRPHHERRRVTHRSQTGGCQHRTLIKRPLGARHLAVPHGWVGGDVVPRVEPQARVEETRERRLPSKGGGAHAPRARHLREAARPRPQVRPMPCWQRRRRAARLANAWLATPGGARAHLVDSTARRSTKDVAASLAALEGAPIPAVAE